MPAIDKVFDYSQAEVSNQDPALVAIDARGVNMMSYHDCAELQSRHCWTHLLDRQFCSPLTAFTKTTSHIGICLISMHLVPLSDSLAVSLFLLLLALFDSLAHPESWDIVVV